MRAIGPFTLQLQFPVDLDDLQEEVWRCLIGECFRFPVRVKPTLPQLEDGYGSFVVEGVWIEEAGLGVVVFDLSAFRGPIFAQYLPILAEYSDIAEVASRFALHGWRAYLFGSHQFLQPERAFRVLSGGVIKLCPEPVPVSWPTPITPRLTNPTLWREALPSPDLSPAASYFVTGEALQLPGVVHVADDDSVMPAIARLVGKEPGRITIATPSGSSLQDVVFHGTWCCAMRHVLLAPQEADKSKQTAFLFVDPRPAGQLPRAICTRQPTVSVSYLALSAGIHRIPSGYCLAISGATPDNGFLEVVSGSTVILGFLEALPLRSPSPHFMQGRSDDEASSSGAGTDSGHSSDATLGQQPSSLVRTEASGSAGHTRTARSRSRSRSCHELPAQSQGFQPASTVAKLRHAGQSVKASEVHMLRQGSSHFIQGPRRRESKLFQEPTSHTVVARARLDGIRDAAHQMGVAWPVLPAADGFAVDAQGRGRFAEALPEPAADFTFGILIPSFVTERVVVRLSAPVDVMDALAVLGQQRDQVQARLFPVLSVVSPMPSSEFGLVIALPGWATEDVCLCFDLTLVDGRLYADVGPRAAEKTTLLSLVGLTEGAQVDIYWCQRSSHAG